MSLVLANLLSALVTMPAHVYNLAVPSAWASAEPASAASAVASFPWSQTLSGLTVLITLASVLSILLISLDRYYAVNRCRHCLFVLFVCFVCFFSNKNDAILPIAMSVGGRCSPLHYTIIVTRQKSAAMIALVWLVALVLSAPVWTGCVALENGAATADADADFLFGSAQQRLDVGSRSQVGASVILGFFFRKKKKKRNDVCVCGAETGVAGAGGVVGVGRRPGPAAGVAPQLHRVAALLRLPLAAVRPLLALLAHVQQPSIVL